ncbi:flagellar brake protein [Limisalsivibrio acetivorans]|uniref:flagellar brake protein n=1 Tax=Limisalsivibrio acetivorans TaxID=1304888 RepID=UPI0012DF0AFA|nr:flagellar brake domain-containing protein [Limisalsivibrio acetivorans]
MAEKITDIEKVLTVNTKLSMGVPDGDYAGMYDSRVEDFDRDGGILTAMPSDSGVPIPLLPGTVVDVSFVGGEGRFRFMSRVEGRVRSGKVQMLKIARPAEIKKEQLREFFRVSTRFKAGLIVYYSKVPDNNLKIPHENHTATLIDISGGGCRLLTNAKVSEGQQVAVDLSEKVEMEKPVQAKVVRIFKNQESKNEVSLEFLIKKESERNPIIKYVFQRQIELRQLRG